MPFRSQAQRAKFYSMAEQGKMPMSTVQEWENATPKGVTLPERVAPKPPKLKKKK